MALVQHPSLGQIQFPDDMQDDQIVAAIKRLESDNASNEALNKSDTLTARVLGQQEPPSPLQQPQGDSQYIRNPNTAVSTLTGRPGIVAAGSPNQQEATIRGLSTTARFGPALVSAPLTGGASLIPAAATMFAAGAGGEALGQGIETVGGIRDNADIGQMAKSGLLSMIPGQSASSSIRATTTLAQVGRTATMGAERAATGYGLAVAGEAAKQAINEPNSEIVWKDVLSSPEAKISAALGGAAGLAEGVLKTTGDAYAFAMQKRAELASVGIQNPTAGMLLAGSPLSSMARMERSRLTADPKFANQVIEALNVAGINGDEVIKATPRSTEILDALAPYGEDIPRMAKAAQEARDAYSAAQNEVQSVRDALMEPTPEMLQNAEQALFKKVAQESALMDFFGKVNPDLVSPTDASRVVGGNVKAIFDIKSNRVNELYKAAGVPLGEPILPAAELAQTLRKGLLNAKGQAEFEPAAVNRILSSVDAMASDGKVLSVAEVRDLRNTFADDLAAAGKQATAYQTTVSKAYAAASEAMNNTVAARFGPEAAAAFKRASDFNASYAEAISNPLLKQLANPDQAEGAIMGLARELADGKFEKFTAYKELVASVNKETPALAAVMVAPLQRAVQKAMIADATRGVQVNVKALAEAAAKPAALGSRYGFDAKRLGFGDPQTVVKWSNILQRNGIKDMTQKELTDFFSMPSVQSALATGSNSGRVFDRAAAELAFKREANIAAAQAALGRSQGNAQLSRLQVKAQKFATDAAQAETLVQSAMQNPLVRAINDLRGGVDAAKAAAVTDDVATKLSEAIATATPEQARNLRRGLIEEARRTPAFGQVPEMVETRLIKDLVIGFSPSDLPGQTSRLNLKKYTDFFYPSPGQGNALQSFKEFVTPERFDRMEKMARILRYTEDYGKSLNLSGGAANDIYTMFGIGAGGFKASGQLQAAMLSRIQRLAESKMHSLITAVVVDRGFANAFARAGGNVTRALETLGPRAAVLTMQVPWMQEDLVRLQGEKAP